MLFRPNFCAHCGERIERVDWGLLTSRRFCPVCETEFKGQDLITRAIVIAGLLIGAFGVGAYLKSGDAPSQLVAKQPVRGLVSTPAASPTQATAGNSAQPQTPSDTPSADASRPQITGASPSVETAEPTFYCGAETKKGTPCSRRVKGNTRCYQHKGMPAIVPSGKLRSG